MLNKGTMPQIVEEAFRFRLRLLAELLVALDVALPVLSSRACLVAPDFDLV